MSEPHSAGYLGDQRDYLWNADWLALVVRRLELAGARAVLDAGAGLGHWSRALLPHLPHASLVGVDREPRWVAGANARATERARYLRADVHALPFADASFDLVTCQTLLIHVASPAATIAHFVRVLRPGGTLLLAEPNNLAGAWCQGMPWRALGVDEQLELVRLQVLCERGKAALGEGDNSVAELLPGMLAAQGLADIRAWTCDRTSLMLPPYTTPAARALAHHLAELNRREWLWWSRADTERYWIAGGGAPGELDGLWRRARALVQAEVDALRAGTFNGAGAVPLYLVAARKPVES